MNKIYKIVWSEIRHTYVAVSEIAKGHGRKSEKRSRLTALTLAAVMTLTGLGGLTASAAIAIGDGAALGDNDGATGQRAIAIGESATATAKDAVAIGYKAKAEGEGAFAFGEDATSNGKGTVAFTGGNKASGTYSMAWGMNNVAGISADGTETFTGATAFGTGTEARNDGATAMGNWTIAEGQNSVAMGNGARTREDAKASLAMGQDTQAAGTGSFAGGTDSIAGGFNSFAHGYTAEAVGSTAIAMGTDAKAVGDESVALGYNSKAYGDYSVAILGGRTGDGSFDYDDDTGKYDVDVTDNAIGAFAAGFGSVAMKRYTVAIGRHATVKNDQSIALGEDATVVADSSVALGYGSVATEENVISVGHKAGDPTYNGGTYSAALNRKIVNVAEGVDDTDAVNVSQLKSKANKNLDNIDSDGKAVIVGLTDVVSGDSIVTVTPNTNADGKKTYTITAAISGDGVVEEGNTGLVTGGVVYDAMMAESRPASNGNYITTDNTAGANLTVLDNQVKTNADDIANLDTVKANTGLDNITDAGHSVIKSDAKSVINVVGADKATVTKADVNGVDTYTVSVKADGAVADGNENIVNGGTVYNALQAQKNEMNTALDGKANIGLDNITDNGKTVVRSLAQEAVKVVNGTNTTVTEGADGNAKTYAVNVTTNGTVTSGDTGVVTGGTVYDAIQDIVTGDMTGKANISLDNVNDAGHAVIKTDAKSAINVVGNDDITVNKTDVSGVDTYTVDVVANGTVTQGNENLVSGGTVYDALQAQKTETTTALEGKANVGLDNITDNGKTVVRTLAQEAVKVVDGTKTTVTEGTDGNAKTYAVNVTVDGAVSSGNDGIVSGGTVYDAIQNAVSEIESGSSTALANKANISLDNINEAGHDVIKTDAKSAINVAEGDHITVAKTDVNGVDTYTVSVKTDGQVTQNNENVVSGGTVYEALQAERETTNTSLEGKANVALDNITDDGHNVIKEDAKSAINVKGGTYATVDKTNVDGVDTYTVNVANDGSVAEGNNKLVTGGTVYEALNNVISDTNTALDGKANTTLNNITDDGKTVVRNLAQEAVKVVNGTNTTVVEGTDGDAKTYAVNVNVNGEIVSGNTDAVSGGTVYDYITELEAGTNASLLNKANVDASNVGKNATTDNSEAWGEALGTGTVADGDGKLVTGGTVHEALMSETRPSADGNYIKATDTAGQNLTALDSQVKTNADAIATNATDISNLKDLSNITETGKTVVKNLAKGSVNVVGADKAVVTKSDVEGVDTYTVSVKADGVVAQGNENIVTGGTVYDAITTATDTMNDALNSKANVSLDNVTEAGHNVIKSDAKSAINVVGKDDVTVTKSDVEGVDTYTVSVVKNGTVTSGNEGIVTGDTVANETRTASNGFVTKTSSTAGENILALDKQVKANTNSINNINQTVNNMGTRINKVGAGAAALAALHPQDFDPDDKWDVAAGYGNYKDANAAAVGAFYHPNEDTMISVGGSFGGGENMVNAGVSVKLGQGNHVTTSRVAMAREILDMKQKMEKLEAQNQYLMKRLGAAPEGALKDVNFPDVPKDHWAYQYVKTLADKGYIEGYPDGEFKGDRAMTRYEYAAVIYRALQNGAPVDDKMAKVLDEFEPELDHIQKAARFRVDRISGKDEDRGKVERVRVNNDQEERDVYGGKIPAALKK